MDTTVDRTWRQGPAAAASSRAHAAGEDRHELVTTPEAFLALRQEWDQLCARVPGHYLGQTFEWASLCWETIAKPRGRELACLVVRRDTALVLAWPLAISRGGWGGSVARPLDSESSEYGNVLVEEGPEAERRVTSALDMLRHAGRFDRLELAYVRPDTVLGRVLRAWGSDREGLRTGSLAAAAVSWRGIDTWAQYLDAIPAHERHEVRRKKRRLAERGDVRVEVLGDAEQCAPVVAWSLRRKFEWLDKTRRRNEWIAAPEHRAFLEASFAAFGASGRRLLFVLRSDKEILATLLSSVDGVRMEWFMNVSHPAYAALSPSQVLREHVLHWAWERGLECDFRLGDQRFKALWCNRFVHTSNYVIATSARGRAFVLATRMKRKLAGRLPPKVRDALRALLGGRAR